MRLAACVDVHKTGAAAATAERYRHLPAEWPHGSTAPGRSIDTLRKKSRLHPEGFKCAYLLRLGGQPRAPKVPEDEVQRQEPPQDFATRRIPPVTDVLSAECAIDGPRMDTAEPAKAGQVDLDSEAAIKKRPNKSPRAHPRSIATEPPVLRAQEYPAVQRDEGDPLRRLGLEPQILDGLLATLQVRDHSSSRPSLPPRPEPPPPPPRPSRFASPSLRLARPSAACMRKPAASFMEISLPR